MVRLRSLPRAMVTMQKVQRLRQPSWTLMKARVRVHRYLDGTLAVFHGPRLLARYDARGQPTGQQEPKAAA